MNSDIVKEDLLFSAGICDRCSIPNEAQRFLSDAVHRGFELDIDQREILSSSYKSQILPLRNSWRKLKSLMAANQQPSQTDTVSLRILEHLESRIRIISFEFLELIHTHIIPTLTGHEGRVYYMKLEADYTRYLSELSSGKDHTRLTERAHNLYKKAADIALCHLPATNVVRVNLMLNFSVFYYEVYNSPERACILGKATYNQAVESGVLDPDPEDRHADARAILKLIKENLSLWTNQAVPIP